MGRFVGQTAAETIIIIGVAMTVVVLFFMLSASMINETFSQQSYRDARNLVNTLAEAADSVYAQGEGAMRKVAIDIPPETDFDSNLTYIGEPAKGLLQSRNVISIGLAGNPIYTYTRAPLEGKFPSKPGKHQIKVVSRGSYVDIYPYLIEANQKSISVVMPSKDTRTASITITRHSWESVTVVPEVQWGFEGVSLSISPNATFQASPAGSTLTLTLTSEQGFSGLYNSHLSLYAKGDESGTEDIITIPLSVNVVN